MRDRYARSHFISRFKTRHEILGFVRCADADVVDRHEPEPKAAAGKLGAHDTLALGAIGGRDVSCSATSRPGARKFTPLRSSDNGRIVSHRRRAGRATNDSWCGAERLRYATGGELPGLGRAAHARDRSVVDCGRRLVVWTRHLGAADEVAGGDRGAAIRAANCRHDANAARTRVLHACPTYPQYSW